MKQNPSKVPRWKGHPDNWYKNILDQQEEWLETMNKAPPVNESNINRNLSKQPKLINLENYSLTLVTTTWIHMLLEAVQ